jgi:hypothetical protein
VCIRVHPWLSHTRVRIRLRLPQSKNEWILGVFAAALTLAAGVPLIRGVLSLTWPKVDGVVTHSRDLPGRRVMGVDIGYRYTVGGQPQTGDRFRFQFWISATSMAGRELQSIRGRYRVGEPVKVAVNPRDPSDSVLEPGPDFNSMTAFGMGLFLLLLAVGEVPKDDPAYTTPAAPELDRPRSLLATGLALSGMALFLFGAYNLYLGNSSVRWPSVEGRILYSHARTGPHPETLLWYEYHVGNQRYVASNYRNGGNITPFDSVATAAAKRYPVGRTMPVYYDPANPQNALLEPGVWWGNFVAPGFAVLLFALAWLAKRYAEVMWTRKAR